MLKKALLLLACFVCFVSLLCGCQSYLGQSEATNDFKDTMKKAKETSPKNTQVTETVSEPVQDETSNPETTEEPSDSEWKTAYLEFLESQKDSHISYALVYVDGDSIPELYLSGGCEATGDCVCSYQNGSVVEERLNRIGGGRYIERSGNLINQNGNMGCYYTHAYKLTEEGFALTFSALSVEHVEYLANDEYTYSYEYFIEDNPVSESEYNAAVDAAFDFEQSVQLDENTVTYDEIRRQIIDCQ